MNASPSSSDPTLADLLRTLATQLHDISEHLSTVTPPRGPSIPEVKDNSDEQIVGLEEPWEKALDALKAQDKGMTDAWKDELNNLLVFAGLFSAVVTAFTVDTYKWLQQDPGDASNMLLANISLQLSSFTIAMANGMRFVNSTAPALSVQDVASSFTVTAVAVPVNILWVLSLTLSLISAFFAIAVQQWLRHFPLSADVPIRRGIQLRSVRYDGLQTWQIPVIISVLPLLLQIAVVLFLAGFFILLRSLNNAVTVAFGIAASTGLIAFIITALIPLFIIRCPYKSPFIPTILIVLQWFSYPFALVILIIDSVLTQLLPFDLWKEGGGFWGKTIFRPYQYVLAYVQSFGMYTNMLSDIGQFWPRREYQYILNSTDSLPLEVTSLIQGLLTTPSRSFAKVVDCFGELFPHHDEAKTKRWRATIIKTSFHRSLRAAVPTKLQLRLFDVIPNLKSSEIETYVRGWLSPRHQHLLWRVFERCRAKRNMIVLDEDEARVLTWLHQLPKLFEVHTQYRRVHMDHLLHICANQTIPESCMSYDTVPASLVFDTIQSHYPFDENDAVTLANFALRCLRLDQHYSWPKLHSEPARLCLAASASALTAINLNSDTPAAIEGGRELVALLADFLDHSQRKTAVKHFFYEFPSGMIQERQFMVVRGGEVIRTICKSLEELARKQVILQHPECSSVRLADSLREICDDLPDEERLVEGRRHLDAFAEIRERFPS